MKSNEIEWNGMESNRIESNTKDNLLASSAAMSKITAAVMQSMSSVCAPEHSG